MKHPKDLATLLEIERQQSRALRRVRKELEDTNNHQREYIIQISKEASDLQQQLADKNKKIEVLTLNLTNAEINRENNMKGWKNSDQTNEILRSEIQELKRREEILTGAIHLLSEKKAKEILRRL